ncbi:unnamed protein product [Blepharisma stoltei]|uniref:Uncharacterized protein n=1 Tax=Blepharisma stoltei TaxID=1481888 RepID=A0AAU9JVY6_9CILI|nr:unnamed protein product [Blepharisma stoltei]
MQDIAQWISYASSLTSNKSNFLSNIEPLKEALISVEEILSQSKINLNALMISENINELYLQSQIAHVQLLAKILFRKRRAMIIWCIKRCIKGIQKYDMHFVNNGLLYNNVKFRFKQNKEVEVICADILNTIEFEKEIPKTIEENENTERLKRCAEKVLRHIRKENDADRNQIMIKVSA